MKSYTDLSQSKKLATILPLESADMWWNIELDDDNEIDGYTHSFYLVTLSDIPCWSLAALLDVLKYPSLTQSIENKWSITDWTGFYPKSENGFDSPVDACYEMIIHLHEFKLL